MYVESAVMLLSGAVAEAVVFFFRRDSSRRRASDSNGESGELRNKASHFFVLYQLATLGGTTGEGNVE